VAGTEVVLKWAAKKGKKVLIASTSEVYGKSTQIPFREDADLVLGPSYMGRWSYACSKLLDEFLALAYHRERDLPVVVVRFFNTVGPRQTGRYGMVIPRFVRAALRGEPLEVYGDGQQSRCFTYVGDVVTALIGLLDHPGAVGQIFNIGNPEEVTIRTLAERVLALTGSNSPIVAIPYEQAYETGFEDMRRRVPSIEKISAFIGYRPTLNLDAILEQVIAHEREQMAGSLA
jgi:UDP-glucose 4-epimerase